MNKREIIVIENGKETRYESVRQTARSMGVALSTIKNRLNGIGCDDNLIIKYTEEREVKVKSKLSKHRSAPKESNTPEPPKQMYYETISTRVCITPCKYKPEAKVGSALCKQCASYRGIVRSEKYVLCAFKDWKPDRV